MIPSSLFGSWTLHFIVSLLSTIAFAYLFHVPKRQWIFTGLTGAFGWITYVICMHFQLGTVVASFLAAVILTWVSRIFAFSRREPITSFLICGIFPIVPGAGIYNTGYNLFMGNNTAGVNIGFETIKIAVAIAIGIGIISSLPAFFFRMPARLNPNRRTQHERNHHR